MLYQFARIWSTWLESLKYSHICQQQQQEDKLLDLQVKYIEIYVYMDVDDDIDDIICYKKDWTKAVWKDALPESM